MMKRFTYISILILWGCDLGNIEGEELKGDFYIQDGWLAFSSEQYDEAENHFNTAFTLNKTNEEDSMYHYLAAIGLGWTDLYKARKDQEITPDGFVKSAGEHFDYVDSIILLKESLLDSSFLDSNAKINLYAGLTFQRAYWAEQKEFNEKYWETTNLILSGEIDILYRESINFSFEVHDSYYFQYDTSVDYEDIILLRIENYILIGDFNNAISQFNEYEQNFGFDCSQGTINNFTIIDCLCEAANDGGCPGEELE